MTPATKKNDDSRIIVPERPPAPAWDANGNPAEWRRDDPDEKFMMDDVEARILGVVSLARKTGTEIGSYEDIVRELAKHVGEWESSLLCYAVYFLWPEEAKTMRDAFLRLQSIQSSTS